VVGGRKEQSKTGPRLNGFPLAEKINSGCKLQEQKLNWYHKIVSDPIYFPVLQYGRIPNKKSETHTLAHMNRRR